MTKIVITAAGKGTRLLAFTKEIDVGTVESFRNSQEITFRKA